MAKARANGRARRILLVDDHPVMRQGLRELLSREPDLEICGEAEDALEAVRLVESLSPDLMIVDISLKGSSGIDLMKRIRAMHPEVRMLVASMHDEVLYADRALRAGAMGYVSKQEAAEMLLDAVRHVLRGGVYMSPEMRARILARAPGEPKGDGSPVASLSDRELEVFEAIGTGRSTREIAEQLHLSVKTIETHRENIKRKLGLAGNIELIQRSCRWVLERE